MTTAEVLKTSSKFILKYDLTIGNDHGKTEKVSFDLAAKTLTTKNFFYNSKFRRMVEPRASEHSTLTRGAVQVEKIFRNTKGVQ